MNPDELKHIAHLARIKITDAELKQFDDLKDILAFVKQLDAIDTTNIEPMAHPLDSSLRLRKDCITETNQQKSLQKCAPNNIEKDFYLVPRIFEAD